MVLVRPWPELCNPLKWEGFGVIDVLDLRAIETLLVHLDVGAS